METDVLPTTNRSMETSNASLWRGECSRSVQTTFDEDKIKANNNELEKPEESAELKRRRFSLQKLQSVEGTQTMDFRYRKLAITKETFLARNVLSCLLATLVILVFKRNRMKATIRSHYRKYRKSENDRCRLFP